MTDVRRFGSAAFTLIELLVVIAIIGILAAIAIPQFAAYRRKGYDADVQTNARNMATAQEAYFVDNNTYTSSVADLLNFGYSQSANVTSSVPSATATTFVVQAAAVSGCAEGTGVATFDQATGQISLTKCGP